MSNWLQDRLAFLTDPLMELGSYIGTLATNHQDSVQNFHRTVASLTTGPDSFQGSAANAMLTLAADYEVAETLLSGGSLTITSLSTGEVIYSITVASEQMSATIVEAEAPVIAGLASEGPDVAWETESIIEATVQGGLDPESDGKLVWFTAKMGVTIGLLVGTFIAALVGAYFLWKASMDTIASKPLPALPQTPQPPAKPGQPGQGTQNSLSPAQNALTASMAEELSKQYGIPLSVVEDIISQNPGLSKDQYALLVQYYKKYGRYPYNVHTVFTGMGQNGQRQIYYITETDMANILSHDDPNLRLLSDAELLALIQKLLQKNPRKTLPNNRKQLIDYYYDLVDDNGYDYTVIIRISTSNLGRIISTYEEW